MDDYLIVYKRPFNTDYSSKDITLECWNVNTQSLKSTIPLLSCAGTAQQQFSHFELTYRNRFMVVTGEEGASSPSFHFHIDPSGKLRSTFNDWKYESRGAVVLAQFGVEIHFVSVLSKPSLIVTNNIEIGQVISRMSLEDEKEEEYNHYCLQMIASNLFVVSSIHRVTYETTFRFFKYAPDARKIIRCDTALPLSLLQNPPKSSGQFQMWTDEFFVHVADDHLYVIDLQWRNVLFDITVSLFLQEMSHNISKDVIELTFYRTKGQLSYTDTNDKKCFNYKIIVPPPIIIELPSVVSAIPALEAEMKKYTTQYEIFYIPVSQKSIKQFRNELKKVLIALYFPTPLCNIVFEYCKK